MWELLRGRRARFGALACTSFIGGLVEAAFLVLVTRIAFAVTDRSDNVELLGGWSLSVLQSAGLAAGLVAVRLGFGLVTAWQSSSLMSGAVASIRSELAHAFLEASWPTQQSDRGGQLQELLTTFVAQGQSLLNSLMAGTAATFSLLALLGTAVLVDPAGALAVIVGALLLGSILRPIRSAVRRRARASADAGLALASGLHQVSQLGLEVHVFNVQAPVEDDVRSLIDRTAEAQRRLSLAQGLVTPIYTGLAYIALIVALAVVASIDTANVATLGAIMLVMLRSLSYGQAIQNSIATVHGALPFVGRLREQLQIYREGRIPSGSVSLASIEALEFKDVGFSYESSRPALSRVTFEIRSKEIIGIVGPSGSGKSTLVQLMLGLRQPDVGTISVDGREISTFDRHDWARKVTFVPQEPHLIDGTIEDNIRFYRADVTSENVRSAAKLAHINDDIEAAEGRYDREVGGGAGRLSGGQQQRISIARALVESPEVLILDEPTSALDVRSEALIRETLRELSGRMTVVVIAHRLSTLDICDRIMVIQDGELKAFDSPRSLEASNDFYSEALTLSGLR